MTRITSLHLGLALMFAIVAVPASPVAAGGWAVTTLDSLPSPAAGTAVEVGFVIRQHGTTPVNLDDVAIVVTDAQGVQVHFDAVQHGDVGHYVATVQLPVAGEYDWKVQQGWFGAQRLGSLTVRDGTTSGSVADYRSSPVVRWGLPVLSVLLGVLALAQFTITMRRRPAAPVA